MDDLFDDARDMDSHYLIDDDPSLNKTDQPCDICGLVTTIKSCPICGANVCDDCRPAHLKEHEENNEAECEWCGNLTNDISECPDCGQMLCPDCEDDHDCDCN